MKNTIKETTRLLLQGTLTKDEADKILLSLSNVIGRLSSQLNKQLEDYIIEGLKIKGFEFENRLELENFIKSNCRCEDNIDYKERVYYVNDIPFFLHKYEVIQEPITEYNNGFRMSANYGSYAYL
jgi:hypothetical protein